MNKQNFPIKYLFLFLATTFFIACAEAPKTEENEVSTEDAVEIEEMNDEDEEFYFMLPSPIQIAAIFSQAGLEFEEELINPVGNLANYNTKTSKYLNFGVFSADLAYCVINDKQQLSIDYLGSVKTLSEEIGMPSIFGGNALIDRFEKNVGNQDTILQLLTIVKTRTDQYLEENGHQMAEVIFFAGAWIEGMYLGANSNSDSEHIPARLIEQMTILQNVISSLKKVDDPTLDIGSIIEGLIGIKAKFEQFESIKKLDMNEVTLSELVLTEEELNTLREDINALRSMVITG